MINQFLGFEPDAAPHLAALEALFGAQVPAGGPLRARCVHRLIQADRVLESYRVQVGDPAWVHWTLRAVWPLGAEPTPVLVSPDGCWPHVVSLAAMDAALAQGVALVWFDRTELAWDGPDQHRGGLVHDHWPHQKWSALAVWAWGLSRSLDALRVLAPERLAYQAVVGHSRGGKAALLAAVTDPRWHAVVSHNSGTGGAADLAGDAPGAEPLAELVTCFPHWLAPGMANAAQQGAVQASGAPGLWLQTLAPRGLCVLQADDDLWANPAGTARTVERLRPHWAGHAERLEHVTRQGGHPMTMADWQRAIAFVRRLADEPVRE